MKNKKPVYIESGINVIIIDDNEIGNINKVFDNFDSITPDFLIDKDVWLYQNRKQYSEIELNERWIAVDCFYGGQGIYPESDLKFM